MDSPKVDGMWNDQLLDAIFGPDRSCMPDDISLDTIGQYKNQVLEFVGKQDFVPGQIDVQGYDMAMQRIKEGLVAKTQLSLQFEVLGNQVETSVAKIEKAKTQLIFKWSTSMPAGAFDMDSHPKVLELKQWAMDKIDAARKPYLDMQKQIHETDMELDAAVLDLLRLIMRPAEIDPMEEELMQELNKKFDAMMIDEQETQPMVDTVIDHQTQAINAISSLPDGPQKTALFAVLEVASTAPEQESPEAQSYGYPSLL